MSHRVSAPCARVAQAACIFSLACLVASAQCQFADDPLCAHLFPRGSQAAGTTSLTFIPALSPPPGGFSGTYVFAFTDTAGGGDDLAYTLDLSDPAITGGRIKITEASLNVQPLTEARVLFRDQAGAVLSAAQQAAYLTTTLVNVVADFNAPSVTLTYTDATSGSPPVVRTRTTEIALVKKALKIRCRATSTTTAAFDNYAGFEVGALKGNDPKDLKIPFAVSTPIARVSSLTSGGPRGFITTQVDWAASNASNSSQPEVEVVPPGPSDPTLLRNSYRLDYDVNSVSGINAPLDETIWAEVTRNLWDAFWETTAAPSPYREILRTRLVTLERDPQAGSGGGGFPSSWGGFAQHYAQHYAAWGMDHLAIWHNHDWSVTQVPTSPCSGPCSQVPVQAWFPAVSAHGVPPMVSTATSLGFLYGLYTLYDVNPSLPGFDRTSILWNAPLAWTATPPCIGPSPLPSPVPSAMSPTAMIGYAASDEATIHAAYGTTLSYGDVMGYQHPGRWVDLDMCNPSKAKTTRDALRDIRALFNARQDIHSGPALSEGAVGRTSDNYEILYAGLVDAAEGTIDTCCFCDPGSSLRATHSQSPRNWWVVPDYSLLVRNRAQVSWGLGTFDRFFPTSISQTLPLSASDLRTYRAYEVTYGTTGYWQSLGPIDGDNYAGSPTYPNDLRYADMVREYYMMQALQEEYLGSTPTAVEYETGTVGSGQFSTASARVLASSSANPLDDFRNPRLRITYQNGLTIWVNHGSTRWDVGPIGGVTYGLFEDGFIAHDPATGLRVFSARPSDLRPSEPQVPFDYADVPNRWTMLDGRGQVSHYDGLDATANGIVVENVLKNVKITEDASHVLSTATLSSSPPSVASLTLSAPATMQVGRTALAKPIANYDNGAHVEFPYLQGTFSSDDPTKVRVNSAGVLRAIAPGSPLITFVAPGFTASWRVTVVP